MQVGNRGQTLGSLGGRGVSHGVPQVGSNWGLGAATNQSTEALVRTLSVSASGSGSVRKYSEGLPWRYRGLRAGTGTGTGAGVEQGMGTKSRQAYDTGVTQQSSSSSWNTIVGDRTEVVYATSTRTNTVRDEDIVNFNSRVGREDGYLCTDQCATSSHAPLKLLSKFKRIIEEKEAFRQVTICMSDLMLFLDVNYYQPSLDMRKIKFLFKKIMLLLSSSFFSPLSVSCLPPSLEFNSSLPPFLPFTLYLSVHLSQYLLNLDLIILKGSRSYVRTRKAVRALREDSSRLCKKASTI